MLRALLLILALCTASGCHLQQQNLWGFPITSRIVKSIDRSGGENLTWMNLGSEAAVRPASAAAATVLLIALLVVTGGVLVALDAIALLVTIPHDLYVLLSEGRYDSLPEWKPNPHYR
ncbi:MAG: hypothetical protein ACYTGX_12300 [Planctomycetota bacterium]